MSNEIEHQINDELLKDKLLNFYKNNKKKIFLLFSIIVFLPIFFQIFVYFKKKENYNLLTQYLKAEYLIKENPKQSIKILNNLKNSKNETIAILSYGLLLEYYFNNKNLNISKEITKLNQELKDDLLRETSKLKKVILLFDKIDENEILELTEKNSARNNFKIIKKQLLFDFYIKNNQELKAKQIYDNKR